VTNALIVFGEFVSIGRLTVVYALVNGGMGVVLNIPRENVEGILLAKITIAYLIITYLDVK
jgi:hypothetical protein